MFWFKVRVLEELSEKLENNLREEHEQEMRVKLKETEEVFTNKIKALEQKCSAEVKDAREALRYLNASA